MIKIRKIWCAVSGHGFGHFSQVAPILDALGETIPDLRVHVAGGVPAAVVGRMLSVPFTHDQENRDVGLVQRHPLHVDHAATAAALDRLHAGWPERVASEARLIADWGADLVLADIPYLSLAAAAQAGVPGVAIASLTWDRVVAAYFPGHPRLKAWLAVMQEAYATTTLALLLTPPLPEHPFPDARLIPPVTRLGKPRRREVREALGIRDERPLVLVTLGGIPADDLPIASLSAATGFHWLVDGLAAPIAQPHVHPFRHLPGVPFHDLVASVDGIVSKPGYGMAIAATVHQIPFLYVRRGTFPDEPPICAWCDTHGRAAELSQEAFATGCFAPAMVGLLSRPALPPPDARGAEVAAGILRARFLGG